MSKIKPSNKKRANTNPVNYYNRFVNTETFLQDLKNLSPHGQGSFVDKSGAVYKPVDDAPGYFRIDGEPQHKDLSDGDLVSKFDLLQVYNFGGNFRGACSYVIDKHLDPDWPYMIVLNDFYKIVYEKDKFGTPNRKLLPYKRETINLLETKSGVERTALKHYESFIIDPDNVNYRPVVDNKFNMYQPFPHEPKGDNIKADDIPYTLEFFQHIFGEQMELGLQYLKFLYLHPKQILPILVLVSKQRQTGKSSFLEYIQMVFGGNYVQLMASDLTSDFNAHYAPANIIGVDESLVDKTHAVERVKSLVTSKTIMVNDKFVKSYQMPFYGKLIMTSNRVNDFMKVELSEIRFWVRKIPSIKRHDPKFYERLWNEIPMFLSYLVALPEREVKSRMVFLPEEIMNEALEEVMNESKSSLCKEIEMRVEEFFLNTAYLEELHATPSDLKHNWFLHDSRITLAYIRKVLSDEMELEVSRPKHYTQYLYGPVAGTYKATTGRYYTFKRCDFVINEAEKNPYESKNKIDDLPDVASF
jgi:hypothetical protein